MRTPHIPTGARIPLQKIEDLTKMQLLIQELWAGILVCISKKAQPRAQGAFLNSQEVAFQGKNPGKTLQEFSDNNRL